MYIQGQYQQESFLAHIGQCHARLSHHLAFVVRPSIGLSSFRMESAKNITSLSICCFCYDEMLYQKKKYPQSYIYIYYLIVKFYMFYNIFFIFNYFWGFGFLVFYCLVIYCLVFYCLVFYCLATFDLYCD